MSTILPSLILIAGVANDIMSKKVHNALFVACVVMAIGHAFYVGGLDQLSVSFLSLFAAFLFFLPLVIFKITGAGDMKLMMAFALASSWNAVLLVSMYSLIWAAIFGLVKASLEGKVVTVFKNTMSLATKYPVDNEKLHRFPYTVALFFGWLSYLAMHQGHYL